MDSCCGEEPEWSGFVFDAVAVAGWLAGDEDAGVGGTSVETTVRVKGVRTCPIVNAAACAFGSRQGFAGVGFGFDGQSYAACAETLVPGVNEIGSA